MIRLATLLWIALAGAMGYALYQLKHEVIALEGELGRLNRNIVQEQESIHVLRAEWAYINQPQRLQSLAQRHLDLTPMSPRQFGRMDNLPAIHAAPQSQGPQSQSAQTLGPQPASSVRTEARR